MKRSKREESVKNCTLPHNFHFLCIGHRIQTASRLPREPDAAAERTSPSGSARRQRTAVHRLPDDWHVEVQQNFVSRIIGATKYSQTLPQPASARPSAAKLRLRDYVASIKNGFVPATWARVFDAIKSREIGQCPFVNLPEKIGTTPFSRAYARGYGTGIAL